jgi:hypothetical protein
MVCHHCKGKLSIKGVAVIDGQLYCKPHFLELFKSGGGKYDNFSSQSPAPMAAAEAEPADKPLETVAEATPTKEPEKPVEEEKKVEGEEKAPTPEIKKESTAPPAEFSSFKLKSTTKPKGGDIFRDLKMRDLDSLKKTVESGGVDTLFQAGSDGVTPIEFAFTANSQECGRFMIKYLQKFVTNETPNKAALVK